MKRIHFCLVALWAATLLVDAENPRDSDESGTAAASSLPGVVDHLAFRVVERRNHALLKALLDQGISPELRSADGTTLLMHAALHGDAEGVRLLLEAGADPNARNQHGATALIWGSSDVGKVRLLVEHGADVNAESSAGATPLNTAANQTEGAASLAFLLEAGADGSKGLHDRSLLQIAAYVGSLDSVKLLLAHAVKAGAPDIRLAEAFWTAISQGHRDIAVHLLEWEGPVKLGDEDLNSGLAEALSYPDPELSDLLLERGARVRDVLRVVSSDVEEPALLGRLIEAGADVHTEGYRGYSALDLARLRGHRTIEAMLTKEGVESGGKLKHKEIPQRAIRLADDNRTEVISEAVSKSLHLLLRSSDVFLQSREGCASCHHQDLPAMASSIALSRGLELPRDSIDRIVHRQNARWEQLLDRIYDRDHIFPDESKQLGYLLWSWSSLGVPANAVTKAAVWHLAGTQLAGGQWQGHGPRMPSQDGAHMATALVVRAFQAYPLEGREAEFAGRIARARRWLERTPARTHTHQAFRVLGLAWAGADPAVLREGIDGLLGTQKSDGGWSQLPNLGSDAWATGLALLAVQAAGLETTHEAYRRGVEFLLSTQFDDGSWFVRSRSFPFQPHFDSHFPFGWDQWISAASTALASASLALALDPAEAQEAWRSAPDAPDSSLPAARAQANAPFEFRGVRTVSFESDIRPLLEDSCLDCHGADRPKGSLAVTDRSRLIKGGESGVPAIVPGSGAESLLVRHVTDQVEDLEMPPLAKRKSYPPLTPDQVRTLITWIDEGAEWPEGLALEDE